MNKQLWNHLYDAIDSFIQLKPWTYLWDGEIIQIYDEYKDENYYCSIMGKNNECIALSIYIGQNGLADLFSVFNQYPDESTISYIMFDQTCLTFYLGDKDEVPKQQLKMMKSLKRKYHKNQYPYFLSFKSRYYPYTVNDEEVSIFITIIEHLIKTVIKFINNEIDVEFNRDEFVYTTLHSLEYSAIAIPDMIDKYSPVELYGDILEEAKKFKRGNESYILDLKYMNVYVEDESTDRPINPLFYIIYNESLDTVNHFDVLSPFDDEIDVVLTTLLQLFEKDGIPEVIYFRNPKIYQSCAHLAQVLNIRVEYMELDFIDDIYEAIQANI